MTDEQETGAWNEETDPHESRTLSTASDAVATFGILRPRGGGILELVRRINAILEAANVKGITDAIEAIVRNISELVRMAREALAGEESGGVGILAEMPQHDAENGQVAGILRNLAKSPRAHAVALSSIGIGGVLRIALTIWDIVAEFLNRRAAASAV